MGKKGLIDLLYQWGEVASIGGILVAAVVIIFKDLIVKILRKKTKLKPEFIYKLLRLIIICSSLLCLAGIYAFITVNRPPPPPKISTSSSTTPTFTPSPTETQLHTSSQNIAVTPASTPTQSTTTQVKVSILYNKDKIVFSGQIDNNFRSELRVTLDSKANSIDADDITEYKFEVTQVEASIKRHPWSNFNHLKNVTESLQEYKFSSVNERIIRSGNVLFIPQFQLPKDPKVWSLGEEPGSGQPQTTVTVEGTLLIKGWERR